MTECVMNKTYFYLEWSESYSYKGIYDYLSLDMRNIL